jgi:hypothetical protein
MIAGIVALGYNKYGYVSPDIVYQSLNESSQINESGNYLVNAAKYLDILQKKIDTIKKEQNIFYNLPKKVIVAQAASDTPK